MFYCARQWRRQLDMSCQEEARQRIGYRGDRPIVKQPSAADRENLRPPPGPAPRLRPSLLRAAGRSRALSLVQRPLQPAEQVLLEALVLPHFLAVAERRVEA